LTDGVSIGQAGAELATIAARLAREYPDTNKDVTAAVMSYNDRTVGTPLKIIFWSLMGAVAFVLLIACGNVANLLLARSAHRSREISVRVALGATRGRIVRQLLVESVLLAVVSGLVGLALSVVGIRWFDAAIADAGKPYWMTFTFDPLVFAFFAAVCVATGIMFGLMPALHVSQTNVLEVLKEGGRSGSVGTRTRRWTGALIVAQLTLTLVLLSGAGLMMRSFMSLYRMDLNMDTSRLLTAQLTMVTRKYPTAELRGAFLRRLNERLAASGDIVAGATASHLPMGFGGERQLILDRPPLAPGQQPPLVTLLDVGKGYFDTLGIRLIRGRAFEEIDGTRGHESAIVNQRFVAMYFPREDPIGRRIRLTAQPATGPQIEWVTIVGIAPTLRQRNFQEPNPDPVVYVPHQTNTSIGPITSIIVRGRGEPAALAPFLRREMAALDADLPLANIRTMDNFLAVMRWPSRVFGIMFAIFAAIALVLAAVGLYAVTAYSVTQRTQEIGIRMALGAQPGQIRWVILRRGIAQIALGLTLGLAGALAVGRLLQASTLLFETGAADPVTLVFIVAVLVTVAVAACLWPVRRAARLDPIAALRVD
jgi:predicted permease